MPNNVWWPCRCGSWSWAHRAACFACNAPAPKWVLERHGGGSSWNASPINNQSGGGNSGLSRVEGAGVRTPSTITVGDFILVGGTKKARKQAKRLEKEQAELAALRKGKAGESRSEQHRSEAAVPSAGDVEMGPIPSQSALQKLSDEKLAEALQLLPDG
eukprot:4996314-Karenia_brevis.AAC.1